MTVFKNYFKILKQNKFILIMYIGILFVFTAFGSTNTSSKSFEAVKPNIAIINNDLNSKVVENLTNYIEEHANIIKIKNNEQALSDALFYNDVNGVMYIYEGYTEDYLNNEEKNLKINLTKDYGAAYMKMILNKYFLIADISNNNIKDEEKILKTINSSIDKEVNIKLDNKVDINRLDKASYYYNFANYSILAISIYIIGIVMNVFNQPKIKKRNLISSKKISSFTKELYLGNLVFSLMIWLFIVILSFFVVGDIMFTKNGLLLILNSLIFTFTALGLGFLIGSIVKNKDAINGLMNLIALGSSFLCGCFIPSSFMPSSVVNASKILPSYWYIHNNDLIKRVEIFNIESLSSIILNMFILLIFATIFFLITLIYNKRNVKS